MNDIESVKSDSGDKISQYLTQMDDNDAKAVEAELVNPVLAHTVLAEILTNNGFPISETSVRRSRKEWKL